MKKFRIVEAYSYELDRIKKLFVKGFRSYLSNKPRGDRLEFIMDVISEIVPDRSDLKLLMVQLNKHYGKPKKKTKKKK